MNTAKNLQNTKSYNRITNFCQIARYREKKKYFGHEAGPATQQARLYQDDKMVRNNKNRHQLWKGHIDTRTTD